MTKLKPCPFCGGEGKLQNNLLGGYCYQAFVKCTQCYSTGPTVEVIGKSGRDYEALVEADNQAEKLWNKRAGETK